MSVNKTHFAYKTYAEIGYASLHKEYKSNLNKYIKSSFEWFDKFSILRFVVDIKGTEIDLTH